MSLTRPAGVAFALLAACSLVPALLVLGTAALLLLAVPTTGVAALVVGVAALAGPVTLVLAAGALLTDRPEGPALALLAAAVTVAAALVGGLPGLLPVLTAVGAVLVAAVLATRTPVVVTPALDRAVTLAAAALLAAHGLALLGGLPAGSDVAPTAGVAVVTAAVALGAWWTARPGVVSPFVAAAAMAVLTTVLAVRGGSDPLPAATATAALIGTVSYRSAVFVRPRTMMQTQTARM